MENACPLCGGAADGPAFPYATRWNGRRFDYLNCSRCGSTFVAPLPTAAEFDLMYEPATYHAAFYDEPEDPDTTSGSFAMLATGVPKGSTLLDFGCGNGSFLKAVAARGYRSRGVEQNHAAIALAQQASGVPVETLEALEAEGHRFDVIHLADVLEHLPDPGAVLRRLEQLLAPGGQFFIEGPIEKQASLVHGVASRVKAIRRRLGMDREGVTPPYHLTLTSWRSQLHFFEQVMGYRCLAVETYETGWPYPARLELTASPGTSARSMIGAAAVAVASTRAGKRARLANRFRALVTPP